MLNNLPKTFSELMREIGEQPAKPAPHLHPVTQPRTQSRCCSDAQPLSPSGRGDALWLQESLAGRTLKDLHWAPKLEASRDHQGLRVRVRDVLSPLGPMFPAIVLGGLVLSGKLL